MPLSFQWDWRKADANKKKHRVTFLEAATVFGDPMARIFDDPEHSADEKRELIIGISELGRLLLISFVEAPINRVRIISARPATKQEKFDYEEGTQG